MSEFDVDDLLPDTKPIKPLAPKTRKSDSRMGATGKQVGMEGEATARIKGNSIRGYDYTSGKVISTTALTPSIKHFEDLHQVAGDLERHITEHEAYLNSNDLHPATRAEGQRHIAAAWNSLAAFHDTNSAALDSHIEGKTVSAGFASTRAEGTLTGATHHLNDSLNHLKKAYSTVQLTPHPIVTNIGNKAAEITSRYLTETNQARSKVDDSVIDRATDLATEEVKPAAVRLPLLTPAERAAQRGSMARKRDVSPRTVVGSEQEMGENRLGLGVEQGPVKEGEVRTPSGGIAPRADAERIRQRIQARDAEVAGQQQEAAAKLKEDRKPAPPQGLGIPDLSKVVKGPSGEDVQTPIIGTDGVKGPAAPVSRRAAELIDLRNRKPVVDEGRVAAFKTQQESASEATQRAWEGRVAGQVSRQNRQAIIQDQIRQTTVNHISAGNYTEAAMFHVKATVDSTPSRSRGKKKAAGSGGDVTAYLRRNLSSRYVAAVQEASANPRKYLAKQGFAVEEVPAQEARETNVRTPKRRATAGNNEVRMTTTPASSGNAFTPQAEEEYKAKLTASDAANEAKRTRAQRNNAAFRGEA
jgi:hypothetical protein